MAAAANVAGDMLHHDHHHHHHVILFYQYHPLSPDRAVTESYRQSLESLCRALRLTGRVLVGCSPTEGINGTLAGRFGDVRAFTRALLLPEELPPNDPPCADGGRGGRSTMRDQAVAQFRIESEAFFASIGERELRFASPDEFKWSVCSLKNDELFPDLHIKLVSELIGTGGALSQIPLRETAQGYLTPSEWRDHLQQLQDNGDADTVLVDCRNTKEYEIGRFVGATDPKTTTFAQFPKWVEDNRLLLEDKNVMLYCTGGIRCEKVSMNAELFGRALHRLFF